MSRGLCCLLTCCQYSSSDGKAEKYPVSCTIWSSWKMLHIGMTSISFPSLSRNKKRSEACEKEEEEEECCIWKKLGSLLHVHVWQPGIDAHFTAGSLSVWRTEEPSTLNSLKSLSAHCKLPPRFKITDGLTPCDYITFWTRTNQCAERMVRLQPAPDQCCRIWRSPQWCGWCAIFRALYKQQQNEEVEFSADSKFWAAGGLERHWVAAASAF